MTDGECAKCKRRLAPASGQTNSMQVDHIVPSHYGGIDHLSNYQPLCQRCNGSKGNRETIDYRPNPREYPVPADAEADRLAQIETFATEKAAAAERRRRAQTFVRAQRGRRRVTVGEREDDEARFLAKEEALEAGPRAAIARAEHLRQTDPIRYEQEIFKFIAEVWEMGSYDAGRHPLYDHIIYKDNSIVDGQTYRSRRAVSQAIGAVYKNLHDAHFYRYNSTRKWYQKEIKYHVPWRRTSTQSMPPIPSKWNVPEVPAAPGMER